MRACVRSCVRSCVLVCCEYSFEIDRKTSIMFDMLQVHYYQPMFTLVGGGLKKFDDTHKTTQSVLPKNCDWLQTSVEGICPNENTVSTTDGRLVRADHLAMFWLFLKSVTRLLHQHSVTLQKSSTFPRSHHSFSLSYLLNYSSTATGQSDPQCLP